MRGLRTQESEKFNIFWDLIQESARKRNSVFFGDCGEGRDFKTFDMEGEDFCGWLIPNEKSNEFEKEFLEGEVTDKWSDYITFVIWDKAGEDISVEFKQF